MSKLASVAIFAGFILCVISCRKEDVYDTNPSAKLRFSSDTIMFDTIFATIGSATKILKVYNDNSGTIRINEIRLAGGVDSPYRINVDGKPVLSQSNVDIDKNDSIYIFIKVTVDPSSQNAPFVVTDSLVFITHSAVSDVDLVAWGQDAHFYVGNKKIEGFRFPYTIVAGEDQTVTWSNDKPHVVYGYAVVDSSGILQVTAGARIHFHKNSGLWVYRGGSIQVDGVYDDPVVFQGDRLESSYSELPGQWDRIWINEGGVNYFRHAEIKNGFIGLQAEILQLQQGTETSLILENCIVKNMSQWALFTIGYRVIAANCLFANCGQNVAYLTTGGFYDFRHCTFANFWKHGIRQSPLFVMSNYLIVQDISGNPFYLLGDLESYFGNCIIYGNLAEEFVLAGDDAVDFNYLFDHTLIKTTYDISGDPGFVSCFINANPFFVNSYQNDYTLSFESEALDKGSMEVISGSTLPLQNDLLNNSRIADDGPDPGAYEYIPEEK